MLGGRARVTGIGEVLEPLPFVAREITLVVPPFGVSTPAVYKAFDSLHAQHDGPNDLEPAAIAVEPRLTQWRDRIREASGQMPVLAGSGATWWLDGAHPRIHEALSEATVVVTHTRSS
jgi:4-diphosphocytidyl-2-C-methyl-D-erythritol kinase